MSLANKSKILDLAEAIRRFSRPGASIFLGWNANAIACELIRQYQGKEPRLNLIMTMTWDHALNMIHCGLVQRLITSSCSYLVPNPSPSHVIQRAFRDKSIEIENWSLYSLQQRLMAGALGIGFMPTKSISGSTMAIDNSESFIEIADPFDQDKRIGAVKALNPGIAMVHALAADQYGNTILSPVSQDTVWGARASLGGVIVTAEKIVSPDFIRQNASRVGIPGYLVKSVSVCPSGAHPEGHFSNIKEIGGYLEDYEFMLEQRAASRHPQSLDEWVKEWVTLVKDHEGYLAKLGKKRIASLNYKLNKTNRGHSVKPVAREMSSRDVNATEMMIVAACRKIVEKVKETGFNVLLAGIGTCGLAAWLAYYQLKKEGVDVYLALGSGVLGYQPEPGDPNLINVANSYTASILTDINDMYGFIISGANARCLSVIGAAQIDDQGNINSTKISPDTYIIGSGGGNDNASGACEVMVVAAQSKRRCVAKVDYITSPGARVKTLVTTMGVYEKNSNGKLVLTECILETRDTIPEEKLKTIEQNCGWKLETAADLQFAEPPAEDEILLLRSFDPNGYMLKD